MSTPSPRLPTVPAALTERDLLTLADHIAAAMPALPPRIVLPSRYAAHLVWDTARWRALPAQLHDALATEQRRLAIASSHAIAAAVDWHRIATRPSHDELHRRRSHGGPVLTAEQIRARAAASWADLDNPAQSGHAERQEAA